MRTLGAISRSGRTAAAALAVCTVMTAGLPVKEVPAEKWVKSLCTSFLRWAEDLAAAREDPDLAAADLDIRKEALVAALEAQTDATTKLLKRSKKAGTPDVEDGKGIAETFRKGYERARDAFANAATDAEDVRTRNLEVYEEDALALQEQIVEGAEAVGRTFATAEEKYDATEVDEAFRSEPACTGVA